MYFQYGLIEELPSGGSSVASLVRSTTSLSTGKWYFEVTVNVAAVIGNVGVGVDNDAESLSGAAGQAGSICWVGNGNVNYNGTLDVYAAAAFSVGNTLCVAVDLVNMEIWFRVNGGNWNNSPTANPATDAGGFSITAITPHAYALAQLSATGDEMTADFNGPFSYAIPSGFSPWGQTLGAASIVGNFRMTGVVIVT